MDKITSVWMIVDEDGKPWRDSVRATKKETKLFFVRDWLSRCPKLDAMDADRVWTIFERNGFSIIELKLDESARDAT